MTNASFKKKKKIVTHLARNKSHLFHYQYKRIRFRKAQNSSRRFILKADYKARETRHSPLRVVSCKRENPASADRKIFFNSLDGN